MKEITQKWPPLNRKIGETVSVELEDGSKSWATQYDNDKWIVRSQYADRAETRKPVAWKMQKGIGQMTH